MQIQNYDAMLVLTFCTHLPFAREGSVYAN